MIKFKRISDEVLYHIIISEIHKYLKLSSDSRIKQEYSSSNIDEFLKFNEYNDTVLSFIGKFYKSFTSNQTKAMLSRLKDLKIKDVVYRIPFTIYCLSLGYYDSDYNEIVVEYYKDRRISKESIYSTLIHELLHMASTREFEDGILTGFEIPYLLGLSLNEGYTEYLTEKYFTKGIEYVKSNSVNLFLAKGIENIIGSEIMQKHFFNADLNGLINELSKYATREEIIRLLFLIDRQGRLMRESKDLFNIIEEIARLNAKKLIRDLEQGLISYEDFQIEYAKKVTEYLKGNMWSEETKVIRDNNSFILQDQGFSSSLYELKSKDKSENKVKYYQ